MRATITTAHTFLCATICAAIVLSTPGLSLARIPEPASGFALAGDSALSSAIVQTRSPAGLRYVNATEAAQLAGLRTTEASLTGGLHFEAPDGKRIEISPEETPLLEVDGHILAPVGYLAFRLGLRAEVEIEYACIRLTSEESPKPREAFLDRFAAMLTGRLTLGAIEARTIDRGLVAVGDELLPKALSLVAEGRSYLPIEPVVERLGGVLSHGPAGQTLEIRGPGGLLAISPDAAARVARRFRLHDADPILELEGEVFVESQALAELLNAHLSKTTNEDGIHLTRLASLDATLIKNADTLLAEAVRNNALLTRLNKASGALRRVAYLTFDDGPTASITPQVLSILEEHDIRATFFVLGKLAERNPELLRRTAALGHAIGNHGYTHIYRKVYASVDSFMEEIEQTNDLFEELLGERTLIVRAPGGSYGKLKKAHYERLRAKNYKVYDWNVDSQDSKSLRVKAAEIAEAVRKQSANKDELVILFHDAATKQETVLALPEIIAYLRERDFEFRPIMHDVEIHARGVVKQ